MLHYKSVEQNKNKILKSKVSKENESKLSENINYLLQNNNIIKLNTSFEDKKSLDILKIMIQNSDNIELKELFIELKVNGLCYNHEYKTYCYLDMYNENEIIEIVSKNFILTNSNILIFLAKLIISNKNIINIYNPIKKI
jgi:hypothetical protein